MEISLKKVKAFTLILSFVVLIISCVPEKAVQITGSIDYVGDADFYIEIVPLHYKYSKKDKFHIEVHKNEFNLKLPIDESLIVYLTIQDQKYPLYVKPSEKIHINIKRSSFPYDLEVDGIGKNENIAYQNFLLKSKGLDNAIKTEMRKFKDGKQNEALALSERKVEMAKEYFANTNFNTLYLKTIGEDFVIKLRTLEYSARNNNEFDVDSERQALLNEAVNSGFFSYESLKAQRAGIRDFTHYYSRTFGIYDKVISSYGKQLAEYDIKRIAYKQLNEKRMHVIETVSEPKAKAYAELFLVAERIGEIPLVLAKESYENYISSYSRYPDFINFINIFFSEVQAVSSGADAIPFTLYDKEGKAFSMDDFLGKYVLLDFWAGWCKPCLEEFPIMRDIYNKYSRKELEIIGISTEIDSVIWLQDIEKYRNPWIQLYGGNGFEQETFKEYKGGGVPFYILINPKGKIVRYNDIRPSFNFTEVLDSLLTYQVIQKISS